MSAAFGAELKSWRRLRRMSQLDLALEADVSVRHLSFLETGRAAPSRAMVLLLADALAVPLGARNLLLGSAGFTPVWRARDRDEPDLSTIRAAIRRMIDRHDPYPGMVIDRHWRLTEANRAAGALLTAFGLSLGDSLLEALFAPTMRAAIDNLGETLRHLAQRLRVEIAHLGGDDVLETALRRILADPGFPRQLRAEPLPPVIPARYRFGNATLSFFSTIAQFGSAEDITLADLRIELMFPADEATRLLLEGKAAPG